ncbi:MAG: DsbE family thiol:disulfide interchange protein, partial [Gammaproteobacteria bacterium]|nr:DsbE family thiol:disulfide interchange protein [Gammaproteobacteria bacterium]
ASWCPSCRAEHPLFMQLSRQGKVNIVGFNYKDRRQDALQWLGQLGDPYSNIPADLSGDVAIDFGVYGAPETYVIDKQGIIRHRYAGAVSHQYWRETLEPMIRELEQQ